MPELTLQAGEHTIRAGDLIQCARLTLDNVAASGNWYNLGGWACGGVIALASITRGGTDDGRWEQCHSMIAVEWRGELYALEFTAAGGIRRGMVLTPLKQRLDSYPGAIEIIPLSERYHHLFRADRVAIWIERHWDDEYHVLGLLWAALHCGPSWARPGKLFCSEAVIKLLIYLGIIPERLRGWVGNHNGEGKVLPHRHAPCQAARIPQFAINKAWTYSRGETCRSLRKSPVAA